MERNPLHLKSRFSKSRKTAVDPQTEKKNGGGQTGELHKHFSASGRLDHSIEKHGRAPPQFPHFVNLLASGSDKRDLFL
jgi:hypothetical protein